MVVGGTLSTSGAIPAVVSSVTESKASEASHRWVTRCIHTQHKGTAMCLPKGMWFSFYKFQLVLREIVYWTLFLSLGIPFWSEGHVLDFCSGHIPSELLVPLTSLWCDSSLVQPKHNCHLSLEEDCNNMAARFIQTAKTREISVSKCKWGSKQPWLFCTTGCSSLVTWKDRTESDSLW